MIKAYLILMAMLGIGFYGVRMAFVDEIRRYFGLKTFASIAAILAAGFVLHNAFIFMAFAGLTLIATATGRVDALCRLVVMILLLPDVSRYVTIGGLNLTYVQLTDALDFAALIVCLSRKGARPAVGWSAEDTLVVVLILCFSIGVGRTANFTGMQRVIVGTLLDLGLPYYLFRRFAPDRAALAHVICALAGAAMILAFVAICEAKMHWSIYDILYRNLSLGDFVSRNSKMRGGLLRAPASFSDSTALALFQIVGALAVISSRRFFRTGLLWFGSIALTVVGLLAAQSRGADLGFLFGLFVMLAARRRYAMAVASAGGGATLVGLLLAIAPSSPKIAALIGAEPHAGADQDYRQTLLRRGLEVGMEHPILGDDGAHVLAKMSNITQGEGLVDMVNTYLTIFLYSGLVGLASFVALTLYIFGKLFFATGPRTEDPTFMHHQSFLAGALGGVLFAFSFTTFLYLQNPYWLMLLLAGTRSLRLSSRSATAPAPGTAHRPMAVSGRSDSRARASGWVADPV